MKYEKQVLLKNGTRCILRNGTEADGKAALEVFNKTHEETENLLTYPQENSFTEEQEGAFLKEKTESEREIEIVAVVDGKIVGTGGIEAVGEKIKLRHRAEFGVGVEKEYWGLGIGKALTVACIECAKAAGFSQLELEVVAENERALELYKSVGFVEFGRNKRGFRKINGEFQELAYMLLEL